MPTAEHRRHTRIKCRAIVDSLGPTLDLSAGGLRILTAHPVPEGSEVRLAFQLPEGQDLLQCHGSVIHVTRSAIDDDLFEVGIQFQRMMSRHRERISTYVRQRVDPQVPA